MIERIQKLERMVKWLYCKVKNTAIGGIQSIVAGDNITVDNSDPANPVVSSTGGGSEQNNFNRIPSATYAELGITPESTIEEKQTAISSYLEGYDNAETDNLFFEIKENVIEYNFDVTANWNLIKIPENEEIPFPVTDLESFTSWMLMNFFQVTVTNFKLEGSRLQATVEINPITEEFDNYFYLDNIEITSIEKMSITNLGVLHLRNNPLNTFNPVLSNTLQRIVIQECPVTNIEGLVIPNSVIDIDFRNMLITEFPDNFILPDNFKKILLESNELNTININFSNVTQLEYLHITNNKISNWSLSEILCNTINTIVSNPPNIGVINIYGNITSSEGTNFKSILQGKGWTVNS